MLETVTRSDHCTIAVFLGDVLIFSILATLQFRASAELAPQLHHSDGRHTSLACCRLAC